MIVKQLMLKSTVNAIKQFEHICLIIEVAKAGGIKILLPYLARVKNYSHRRGQHDV